MFVATANGVRVTLENIGEGYSGDYDPTDPDDKPLLRFYVERYADGEWHDVEDGSYCTCIPEDTDKGQKFADVILTHVYGKVVAGDSIKRECADLSWLGHKGEGQLYVERHDQGS